MFSVIRRFFEKPVQLSPAEAAVREARAMFQWWLLGFGASASSIATSTQLIQIMQELHAEKMSHTHICAYTVNISVGNIIAAAPTEDREVVLALIRSPGRLEVMLSQPTGDIRTAMDDVGFLLQKELDDPSFRSLMWKEMRTRRQESGLIGSAFDLYAAIHHMTDRMRLAVAREPTKEMQDLYVRLLLESRNALLGLSSEQRQQEHAIAAFQPIGLADESSDELDDMPDDMDDTATDGGISRRQ